MHLKELSHIKHAFQNMNYNYSSFSPPSAPPPPNWSADRASGSGMVIHSSNAWDDLETDQGKHRDSSGSNMDLR